MSKPVMCVSGFIEHELMLLKHDQEVAGNPY